LMRVFFSLESAAERGECAISREPDASAESARERALSGDSYFWRTGSHGSLRVSKAPAVQKNVVTHVRIFRDLRQQDTARYRIRWRGLGMERIKSEFQRYRCRPK